MARCCACPTGQSGGQGTAGLPLICLVPRGDAKPGHGGGESGFKPASAASASGEFQLLDEEYIKKHFKLSPRALYLDPFRRPLISFPMSGETTASFNMARKQKINQQILDGFLDPSEAISAPSVFPYAKTEDQKRQEAEDDEETIYILQLPDWEFKCPVHNQTIRTPRFIWHSCKKAPKEKGGPMKQGGGPLNRPKPWLLSRHVDFDLLSQCPTARPGFDALGMAAPVLVNLNPSGKWESCAPDEKDDKYLQKLVQYLMNSQSISAAQSYCAQCAAENKASGKSNYVPIIMMPILPADQCPFNMDCEIQRMKDAEAKGPKKAKYDAAAKISTKEKDASKSSKKRAFFLQRLSNFDLESQW